MTADQTARLTRDSDEAVTAALLRYRVMANVVGVLLIALIVVAFGANLPSRASDGLRVLGFFLGLVGVAVTYYTLSRYAEATHDLFGTSSGALDNADLGIWCALGGYLLAGVGAALGPLPPKED